MGSVNLSLDLANNQDSSKKTCHLGPNKESTKYITQSSPRQELSRSAEDFETNHNLMPGRANSTNARVTKKAYRVV